MFNLPEVKNVGCQRFLEELESLPVEVQGPLSAGEVLTRISGASQQHAQVCVDCSEAVHQLVETRNTLQALKTDVVTAGPWFAKRVMAAITARENEIEEQKNGVWIIVRRMAPRLVAFCALLLVVGSTWALQLRRAEEARRISIQQAEGLFDTGPSTPVNDDAVAILGGGEARP
jgi:hypothetical protein